MVEMNGQKKNNSSKLSTICFRHANVDLVAWFFFLGGGHVQQPCLPKHLGNSSARAWDALWFCSTGLLPSFMWANLTWHMTPLGLVRSFLMLLTFWNPSSRTSPATIRARSWKTIRSTAAATFSKSEHIIVMRTWISASLTCNMDLWSTRAAHYRFSLCHHPGMAEPTIYQTPWKLQTMLSRRPSSCLDALKLQGTFLISLFQNFARWFAKSAKSAPQSDWHLGKSSPVNQSIHPLI